MQEHWVMTDREFQKGAILEGMTIRTGFKAPDFEWAAQEAHELRKQIGCFSAEVGTSQVYKLVGVTIKSVPAGTVVGATRIVRG